MLWPLLFSLSAHAAIFGDDTRNYVNQSTPFALEGRATAIAVLTSLIGPSETKMGTLKVDADSMSNLVCEDERFSKDPSISYACSGFLVAPDLLVTAGHCMTNGVETKNEPGMYCGVYGWLFDYEMNGTGKAVTDGISPDNYYKCKQIVYAVREDAPPYRDYALVQLDRPVKGRTPFRLAEKPVTAGDTVSMIGFPFGSPMKISAFKRVTINDLARQSFLTTLSAFEGNSGSVVFNDQREAVGILVAGTPSNNLVEDVAKSCQRYNKCDESGQVCTQSDTDAEIKKFPGYQGVGSEVQRIAPLVDLIKNLK